MSQPKLTLEAMTKASELIAPNLRELIPHGEFDADTITAMDMFISEFEEILEQFPHRMDRYQYDLEERISNGLEQLKEIFTGKVTYVVHCWDCDKGEVKKFYYDAVSAEDAMRQCEEFIGNDLPYGPTHAMRSNEPLKTYSVKLPTSQSFYASFDYFPEVRAINADEAKDKAKSILMKYQEDINHLIKSVGEITINTDDLRVELVK